MGEVMISCIKCMPATSKSGIHTIFFGAVDLTTAFWPIRTQLHSLNLYILNPVIVPRKRTFLNLRALNIPTIFN